MATSALWTDIDLEADGVQQGYFRLPLATHDKSGDDVGYSWSGIPVISIRNGAGPRVLLMAGNHGNEYEGQIALMKLAGGLRVADVSGQIIILPGANAPAVRADRRNSPLDDGNLNRMFPGSASGSPTAMIAHLIESDLLPRVECVIDLHSGSRSIEYSPCAVVAKTDDKELLERSLRMLKAFGMPLGMIIDHSTGGGGSLIGACRRTGVAHMSTELGGGGSVSRHALRLAEAGLRRSLVALGVLRGKSEPAAGEMRLVKRLPARDYVYAQCSDSGFFEALVDLGDEVAAGSAVGQIHFPDAPWRKPEPVVAAAGGLIVCKRLPARTALGDCVFVLARDLNEGDGIAL